MTTLKLKRIHPAAELPAYATEGAACFDIRAILEPGEEVIIWPGMSKTFRTGLVPEIEPGYKMNIHSRSGHGFNDNVRLSNATGIIDCDYRGELKVKLACDEMRMDKGTPVPFVVRHGDRIAQAEIVPVTRAQIVEVEEVSETARGAGGFGSTGVK